MIYVNKTNFFHIDASFVEAKGEGYKEQLTTVMTNLLNEEGMTFTIDAGIPAAELMGFFFVMGRTLEEMVLRKRLAHPDIDALIKTLEEKLGTAVKASLESGAPLSEAIAMHKTRCNNPNCVFKELHGDS